MNEHERVVLRRALPSRGLLPGDVGTVIHAYADRQAYEVEFLMLDGRTAAVVTVEASDIRPVSTDDITHARVLQSSGSATLRDVTSVEPMDGYRLRVRFDDGVDAVIDVRQIVRFDGVFEPLRDPGFFAQVKVHPELHTACWPNGADLDSDVVYAVVTRGVKVPVLPPRPGAPTVTVEDVNRLLEDDL